MRNGVILGKGLESLQKVAEIEETARQDEYTEYLRNRMEDLEARYANREEYRRNLRQDLSTLWECEALEGQHANRPFGRS